MLKTILTGVLAMAALAATPAARAEDAAIRSGHAEAGGISYYYEVQGQGEPLLLLHGGLGSIDMFRPLLPALAAKRQVIAVDLQGHGRTPLGDRPIDLVAMGADMAAVLQQLGVGQADVLGYSLGGGVAFQLAVQHPEMVRRLALVSAGYASDGFYPEMLPQQAMIGAAIFEQMKQTPMYASYKSIAPRPDDFPKLLDKMGAYMRQPYDWSADVKKVVAPTLLVYGDADMITLDHAVSFYHLLGGGQKDAGWQREHISKNRLAILPNVTHYDIATSPLLVTTALPFLEAAP